MKEQVAVLGDASIQHSCLEGKTIIESLKESVSSVDLESEANGLVKVIAIDGHRVATAHAWVYRVDGKDGIASASEYRCRGTETIVWEIR